MKKTRWFSKWLILTVIAVTMISTFIVGRTWALFNDSETSTGNTSTAWTSTVWTQTSQADFNAGVLSNVDITTSPDNVQLPTPVTSYSPSGNSGNWTNGANGYSSDNGYATYTPSTTLSTRSPTTNNTGSWATPNNAHADAGGAATITSGAPSGNSVWGTYGFSLGSVNATNVRVRYDAWATQPTITLRAAGANATGTTSVTCSQPTGTATNDVLIAFIVDRSTTNAQSAAPTGWQARGYAWTSGRRFQVFTAVVGKNGLTGTSWSFTGLVTRSQGMIIGYYNADTTGYGGLDTAVSVRSNASGTYGTASITTVTNNTMIVAAFSRANAAVTWSAESCATIGALTERFDATNPTFSSIAVADKLLATAGATGASTATPSAAGVNLGIMLALKPAADYPQARVDISWDGGTSWSSKQTQTLTASETTYWYDVTAATAWTATKLNDTNLKVRVDAQTVGTVMTVNLDWLPVEVTYYDTTVWSHTYGTYGISLTGDFIIKVEVGIEAYAASSEKVQLDVTWNNGTNWSSQQTSNALPGLDPNGTTWFDFTSATSWTPTTLNDTNFKARIWYLNNGAYGQVSLDYIPVRVTYRLPSGTIASQVFDTTVSGSGWDGLAWDKLAGGTNITFEVRASDTSFLKDAASPSWSSSLGGTSPVVSGLASGRYKQWRATLTTSDISTPTLQEVRVFYYGG